MRIGTWNVNSARARRDRITDLLARHDIDVLALQETKLKEFPEVDGYEVAHVGYNQWNGVAILSRVGLDDVQTSFLGQPDYEGKHEGRAVSAVCGGKRIWSLYVPNGRDIDHPHYDYKLRFLYNFARYAAPEADLAMGDFNVVPRPQDVYDESQLITHVTEPERAAFEYLTDVLPIVSPDEYTYWDYQARRFDRNQGMRIDFQLSREPAIAGFVDRKERAGKSSDHAPLICDYT